MYRTNVYADAKNGYPVFRDKDKNICIKGSVRSGLAEINPITCAGFTTPKLNISDLENLANKVSVNPFDIARKKIINYLEQSCKNYIKENNISLDDWKKYSTMNVFNDDDKMNPFPYTAGLIRYKDEVIIRFGRDPTDDLGFLVFETWRK